MPSKAFWNFHQSTLALGFVFLAMAAQPAAAQTTLNLSASGQTTTKPDEINASLNAEATSTDPSKAQAQVNTTIKLALEKARSLSGVVATTTDYSVWENTPADPHQKTTYHASQTLQLTMAAPSDEPPKSFTVLVGALQQDGLLLNSLEGDLSPKGQNAGQQAAIVDAIHQLQAQAAVVAKTLNDTVGQIKNLTVDLNAPNPWPGPRPMMMMAAQDAATPPQAAAADVTVQATVSATITLTSAH